jgi:hypothetical protein
MAWSIRGLLDFNMAFTRFPDALPPTPGAYPPSPPGAAFTLLREGDAFLDEEHNLLIAVERIVPCAEQPLVSPGSTHTSCAHAVPGQTGGASREHGKLLWWHTSGLVSTVPLALGRVAHAYVVMLCHHCFTNTIYAVCCWAAILAGASVHIQRAQLLRLPGREPWRGGQQACRLLGLCCGHQVPAAAGGDGRDSCARHAGCTREAAGSG